MTLQITQQVDARGLACPMPIVKTAMAIRSLPGGSTVEVLATDPGATRDFVAWTRTTGNELVEQTTEADVFRFVIRKRG